MIKLTKIKKKINILLLIFIIFIIPSLFLSENGNLNSVRSDIGSFEIKNSEFSDSKVFIKSNNGLDSYCSDQIGDGTEFNPYIIENLNIDASFSGAGIEIRNTDKYLLIRNCTIINGEKSYFIGGIFLCDCTNAVIFNCTITNSGHGIDLERCSDILVIKNNLSNNIYNGLRLDYSADNTVLGNQIIDNFEGGVRIDFTEGNIIKNNLFRNFNNQLSIWGDITTNNWIFMNIFESTIFVSSLIANNNHWDNGTHGNYWYDYESKYSEALNDGLIWNTPYQIRDSSSYYDNYPLVLPPDIYDYDYEITTTDNNDGENTAANSTDNNDPFAEFNIPGYPIVYILGVLGLGIFSLVILHKTKKEND